MKKLLMITAAAIMIPAFAIAQTCPQGYILTTKGTCFAKPITLGESFGNNNWSGASPQDNKRGRVKEDPGYVPHQGYDKRTPCTNCGAVQK